jgi:hypothetical protein
MARVRAWLTPWRRQAIVRGLVIAGLLYFPFVYLNEPYPGFDASAYWGVNLANLYTQAVGDPGLFPYSPAAAQIAQFFHLVPWPVFLGAWWVMLLAVLAWLASRATVSGRPTMAATARGLLILLAFLPIQLELVTGNVHLLMAAAIVIGFRWPAAWAFVLLTKLTPGIGLLWFALRREWRRLAIALATTAAIVGVSYVAAPDLWARWFDFLRSSAGSGQYGFPLWMRLPLSIGLIVWGARRDARWVLPAAAMLALPVMWVASVSMLAGCWALWAPRSAPAADQSATAGQRTHQPATAYAR